MEVADPQDVKYQCPCGWIGGYAQVNGHRLGSRDPLCKSASPKVLIDRTREVFQPSEKEEEDSEEEGRSTDTWSGLEEETPEEGVPTAAQGRPPESKVAGPSTAKGPVGVPSSGVSFEPSTVRLNLPYPVEMLAHYDWAKREQGYRGSFLDFIVESFLDYWFGKAVCSRCNVEMTCPQCGAAQPTYALTVTVE